jgi:malonyl-CoA O-methyltransferase
VNAWNDSILRRFDAAAATYEGHAGPQFRVARDLAARVLALSPRLAPEVLEIGCGTGFLTDALAPGLPGCRWLATDLAPNMVAACARRNLPGVVLRVMDGEFPDLPERSFDLIVSSLAVQWFGDLAAGLTRLHGLLRPGGVLAVTTLGAGTFPEWRRQCHSAGAEPGTPAYPSAEALAAALPGCAVLRQPLPHRCGSLKGFLDHLRLTGARTAAPGHPALSPAALGRILRAGGAGPFTATYDVLTVIWRKEP